MIYVAGFLLLWGAVAAVLAWFICRSGDDD